MTSRVNPFLTNADEAERGSKRRLGKGAQRLSNIGEARSTSCGDQRVADGRQDLRSVAAAHPRGIFIQGHITDPVQLVLAMSVSLPQGQEIRSRDLVKAQTTEGIVEFDALRSSSFVGECTFQAEQSPRARPVDEIIIHRQGPQPTPFNPSVPDPVLLGGLHLKLIGRGEKAQTSLAPSEPSRVGCP